MIAVLLMFYAAIPDQASAPSKTTREGKPCSYIKEIKVPVRNEIDEEEVDLTVPSGLQAEQMQLQYDLKGLEQEFLDAEKQYGVRADFLAAVAALESGWGRYLFRENNLMGFGEKTFVSKAACIDYVAAYLATHYLDPDGIYYNGPTVEGVCVRYNGSEEWKDAVCALMQQIRGEWGKKYG